MGPGIQICGLDLPQLRMHHLPKVIDNGLVCTLGTEIPLIGATRSPVVVSFDVPETVLLPPHLMPPGLHQDISWLHLVGISFGQHSQASDLLHHPMVATGKPNAIHVGFSQSPHLAERCAGHGGKIRVARKTMGAALGT